MPGTFKKVKLRSARIFVTEARNLKIKIPLVYLKIFSHDTKSQEISHHYDYIGIHKRYNLQDYLYN